MSSKIAVEDLRVGMFVHLDLGWWAHPFPLSSFLIASDDQIATIRGLGVSRVRWSPERSRLPGPEPVDGPPQPAAAAGGVPPMPVPPPVSEGDRNGEGDDGRDEGGDSAVVFEMSMPAAMAPATAAPAGAALPSDDAAAQALCRAQLGEARSAWLDAARVLEAEPDQARHVAEGIVGAMIDKMSTDRDLCVRALGDDDDHDAFAGHALNVAVISMLMGRAAGLRETELRELGIGALLHDIGKIGLPAHARQIDEHSPAAAQALWRDHVARGVAHGRRMGLAPTVLLVIAQHHEHADGSGHPQRIELERMSTASRIVALVNRYDGLCNPVHPAAALTPHEALSRLFAQHRTQFDPQLLSAFIRMMGVYPPGSVVQLTDDRYASVLSVNSSRPLKPRVLACDDRGGLAAIDLDRAGDLGIRRSLRAAQLPAEAHECLRPQQRMVYFFEALGPARPESVEPAPRRALAA